MCYQGAAWMLSASLQGYQTEDISLVGYVFVFFPSSCSLFFSLLMFVFCLFYVSLVALLAPLAVLSDSSLDYQTE